MSYFYARLGEEVRIKDHKLADLVEAFLIKIILFYGGSSEKCKDGLKCNDVFQWVRVRAAGGFCTCAVRFCGAHTVGYRDFLFREKTKSTWVHCRGTHFLSCGPRLGFNSELIRNDNNSSHNSGSYF